MLFHRVHAYLRTSLRTETVPESIKETKSYGVTIQMKPHSAVLLHGTICFSKFLIFFFLKLHVSHSSLRVITMARTRHNKHQMENFAKLKLIAKLKINCEFYTKSFRLRKERDRVVTTRIKTQ